MKKSSPKRREVSAYDKVFLLHLRFLEEVNKAADKAWVDLMSLPQETKEIKRLSK